MWTLILKSSIGIWRFNAQALLQSDCHEFLTSSQYENLRSGDPAIFTTTIADRMHLEIERLRALGLQGDEAWHSYKAKHEAEIWI